MVRADHDVPVIDYNGDTITLSTKATNQDFLKDVTATDEKDGDVTKSLVVESVSKMAPDGTRTITYAAFDSDNHVTTSERTLVYKDYSPPHFALSKPLIFAVNNTDITANLTVKDRIDGDLTKRIKYIADDTIGSEEGKYLVEFQVTNSAGQTTFLPVTVEFKYPSYQQNLLPNIELTNYLIYLKKGAKFDPKEYIKEVLLDGEKYSLRKDQFISSKNNQFSINKIKIECDVKSEKTGVYDVEYSMTSEEGFHGATKLIVVVEE